MKTLIEITGIFKNNVWNNHFKLILIVLVFPLFVGAQESKLAQQYYASGEFEKAASLYQKLYDKSNSNDFYFNRYVDCLIALEEYSGVEEILKKQIKKKAKRCSTICDLWKSIRKTASG